MSLIERAADLLGSVQPAQQKPAAADESIAAPDLGVIERASRGASEPVRQAIAGKVPVDGGGVSRTVKVDLNKLRDQRIITPEDERTAISECFRRIKQHILANISKNPKARAGINLVMITSPLPGEGKTFCTLNLAISLAMEMDRTVLLVDADVAKPSIVSILCPDVKAGPGLMDVLLDGSVGLTDALCRTDIGKLTLLPAGTPHARATEVLASERMRGLLKEMAERYPDRIIIFDSPPLLAASEACVLAGAMGQVVLIVEAGKTTQTTVKEALHRIESSNVVGVLLNKGVPPGSGDYGYGYGYGYGSRS
jgi:receptor protein-tyrosine kinase